MVSATGMQTGDPIYTTCRLRDDGDFALPDGAVLGMKMGQAQFVMYRHTSSYFRMPLGRAGRGEGIDSASVPVTLDQ